MSVVITREWLSHDLVILATWVCRRTQIGSNAKAHETFLWLLGVTCRYYELLAACVMEGANVLTSFNRSELFYGKG